MLAGYLTEELDVLSSGLEESDDIGVEVEAYIASPDFGMEVEKGAVIFLREPAGDPGTEGNDDLASLGEVARVFMTMAFEWSTELRRLPGKIMSPLKKPDVDRLKDIVRVNSPALPAGARRTFVKPAPSA